MVKSTFILLALLFCGCTITLHQNDPVGLLAPDDVSGKGLLLRKKETLEGKSCSTWALFIPMEKGFQHQERAVREALKGTEAVAMANVTIKDRVFLLLPFYMARCWYVEGVPAILMDVNH